MHHRLALVGFGNVARALARLLLRKQDVLKADYDVTFSVTGIATGRHGFAAPPSGIAAPAAPTATAGMFVSVGRQDGTTAADLVAVLTKEVRVDKSKIGRIELKEAYCLVELPAAEVEQIVWGMDGRTVRNKKIMAKVYRGPVTAPPKRRAPTSGGSRAP